VLYPGSVQEVLDLGLHGYALSRCSGLWVGVKCATDVCDEAGTAEVSRTACADRAGVGDRRAALCSFLRCALFAPSRWRWKATLHSSRLEMARRYAAANGLNRIVARSGGDRIGIIATGKTWFDLRQAMRDLGLEGEALQKAGVRLLKVGMPYPLEPASVREFAEGLEEILVVEEKRSFLELLLRGSAVRRSTAPAHRRQAGRGGGPARAIVRELDADSIAPIVAARLAGRPLPESARSRIATLDAVRRRQAPLAVARSAYFCSGCPHNTSTVVPEGSIAGGGIGAIRWRSAWTAPSSASRPWAGRGPVGRRCLLHQHAALFQKSATARSSTPACWRSRPRCLPA